ncbi:Noc2p family-domain-containing protein [Gongronella butleri]|nr:Noc2p family-domain-containing protein [Gongronella butleri]
MELDTEEDEDEKDESEKDDDDSASDDASNSDDDDEEGGDSKEKLKRDAERHKQEMEELKKRDPEFYKYLSKEDAELLDFDMSDEEAGDAGSDAEEQEDDESAEEESDADDMGGFDDADLTTVTASMLASWVAQIEKKGDIKAARRLFAAFKSATKMNDEEEREKHNFVYKIVDPEVFNKVLTSAMHYAPIVFDRHLKSKPGANPRKSKSWSHLQSMVKSYLHNMLYLLKSLTDVNMQYLAVQEAEKCTAYWVCFERLPKDYLKVLLNMYSSMGSSDNVRIQSFLAIRSLASTSHHTSQKKDKDEPMLDLCLKYTYLEFVRTCKNTNAHTLPSINLMRNLAVDLFGLDHDASYQQAFVYIRQLAVHLRGAMQTRSDETYKAVYNWQYIHCIDFWTNVLATYCQPSDDTDQESPLKSLIYPLSQVALGAVRLIPTAQYYPLRFHILKSLASLSRATKAYITLVPYILEVLNSTELQNKAKPSTAKALDWDVILRAPKTYLHGRVYQDGIIEQVVAAMDLALSPYYHDLSFPELAIPAIVGVSAALLDLCACLTYFFFLLCSQIKRFVKKSGNVKGNGKLLKLVHTVRRREIKGGLGAFALLFA